jgi:DnaJ-class molecular chaperone
MARQSKSSKRAGGEGTQAQGAQGAGEGIRPDEPCMPCGGRGTVIAAEQEGRRQLTCPWCDGSGRRRVGIDAQERWLEDAGQSA